MIRKIVYLVIILILLGIAGGYYLGTHYKITLEPQNAATTTVLTPTPQLLGGDRDAHGCIGSAGYSWCEEKQKCLRSWEEPCSATMSPSVDETATLIAAVKAGLDAEHGVNAPRTVTVNKIIGNYAQGGATSGEAGGGMWFAAKVNGVWKLVWDGNGTISCTSINSYNFPASMIPDCWNETTRQMVTR